MALSTRNSIQAPQQVLVKPGNDTVARSRNNYDQEAMLEDDHAVKRLARIPRDRIYIPSQYLPSIVLQFLPFKQELGQDATLPLHDQTSSISIHDDLQLEANSSNLHRTQDPEISRDPIGEPASKQFKPKERLERSFMSANFPQIKQGRQRRNDIIALLDSVIGSDKGDVSHVFICWGEKNSCIIEAVEIENAADDVAIMNAIRHKWYLSRGFWRRWASICDAKHIEAIAIAGPKPHRFTSASPQTAFLGRFSVMERRESERKKCEVILRDHVSLESKCRYNSKTRDYDHHLECKCSYGRKCVQMVADYAEGKLSTLEMYKLLKLVFQNPSLAASNDLVQEFVHSHRHILDVINARHCPRLGELQFSALYIESAKDFEDFTIPIVAILLILSVPLAKLAFGDWATAWNVGGFFVALVTLCLMSNGILPTPRASV